MEGIILSHKREPNWYPTNIWLVKYRVRINDKIEERSTYVTGLYQAHNDGKINMQAALAVAAVYGGKRIRVLSTKFINTGVQENR